jgi:hypothetical protein
VKLSIILSIDSYSEIMLVVLRQLVGLHRGAHGVWLLPSCTCWHLACNHVLVNFVIYVLMHMPVMLNDGLIFVNIGIYVLLMNIVIYAREHLVTYLFDPAIFRYM